MGYKAYSDSYLMSLTKAQIIELPRVAEHNFFATEEALNNSAKAGMEIAEKYDEAKRLLRLAVKDMKYCLYYYHSRCDICALLGYTGECPVINDKECGEKCEWRYADEVEELLNDEK